ncbi:uncharacterized protein LOC103964555 [Pyrus x bretschneideri]|uniref:uncharacterized protein LOC103964555 n=1 Tax=Pyrus x bretschneideri TaxID=225117 RepID=UPI002030DF24|nr:uncharacterized protein LOC103964555 [Pyrus x bretschneideri]
MANLAIVVLSRSVHMCSVIKKSHDRMMKDYFIERLRFPAHDFRMRFWMRRELFESIFNAVVNYDHYFARRLDVVGRQESTAIENLERFCKAIEGIYGATYLRNLNRENLKRLLRKPTIVLKAVASYDTWIWHAFFGTPGLNNDINVLWFSPLFDNVVNGWAPEFQFKVNSNRYELSYYLTDGIYPSWSTFIKSFSHPNSAKKKLFSQRQESYRKDVERAYEILQA